MSEPSGPRSEDVSEVKWAMAEIAATRNVKFDSQDSAIWKARLKEHNHSGLAPEAARRFTEDEQLQDTPVTLASFLRVVKQVRGERIAALQSQFPQPPSGITDEQYRRWMQVRNECAVRQVPVERIDGLARQAINAPARPPVSDRPSPAMRLPGPSSQD